VLQLEGTLYSLFSSDGKPYVYIQSQRLELIKIRMGHGKHVLGRELECGDEITVGGKDVCNHALMMEQNL
jgi:hypothetical protein